MFSPFPFVIFWPFVHILYLATSKLLLNIWKNWLPFLWSSSIGLHSSYSLYTVLHSHIYFPHFFVYIQFYHISSHFSTRVKSMLCSNTHYSLLFLTLHFLTDHVEYLFPEWQLKKKKKKNVCNGENMFLFTPTAALTESHCHCFPTELAFPNLGIPISLFDRIFLFFLRRCAFFKCQ